MASNDNLVDLVDRDFSGLGDATTKVDDLKNAFADLTNAISKTTFVDTANMVSNNLSISGIGSGTSITTGQGYTFAPNTGTYFWETGTGIDLCGTGHVAVVDSIEYVDGQVVSRCGTCGARLVMGKVAGGLAFLRIQTILGQIMSLDEEVLALEGVDLGEILGDFAQLREDLEKEEYALRQARRLFDLAEQILATKVSDE